MAVKSFFWDTETPIAGGDGLARYTQEEFRQWNEAFSTADATTQAVLGGYLNGMAVSGSSSPLSVDTGGAIVKGFPIFITGSAEALTVTTPAVGDTGGRVVLQADWLTAKVRPVVLLSTDGNPSLPTLTQSSGVNWEVSIASFIIDTGGNIWTDSTKTVAGVTDTRGFIISPFSGMIKLRTFTGDGTTGVADFTNLQQDLSHLLIIGRMRSDVAALSESYQVYVNGNSGSSWDYVVGQFAGGTGAATAISASSTYVNTVIGNTATASYFDGLRLEVFNYTLSGLKNFIAQSSNFDDVAGILTPKQELIQGWIPNTAAINRLTVALNSGNFLTGSQLDLYGIK